MGWRTRRSQPRGTGARSHGSRARKKNRGSPCVISKPISAAQFCSDDLYAPGVDGISFTVHPWSLSRWTPLRRGQSETCATQAPASPVQCLRPCLDASGLTRVPGDAGVVRLQRRRRRHGPLAVLGRCRGWSELSSTRRPWQRGQAREEKRGTVFRLPSTPERRCLCPGRSARAPLLPFVQLEVQSRRLRAQRRHEVPIAGSVRRSSSRARASDRLRKSRCWTAAESSAFFF